MISRKLHEKVKANMSSIIFSYIRSCAISLRVLKLYILYYFPLFQVVVVESLAYIHIHIYVRMNFDGKDHGWIEEKHDRDLVGNIDKMLNQFENLPKRTS